MGIEAAKRAACERSAVDGTGNSSEATGDKLATTFSSLTTFSEVVTPFCSHPKAVLALGQSRPIRICGSMLKSVGL